MSKTLEISDETYEKIKEQINIMTNPTESLVDALKQALEIGDSK